MSNKDLTNLNIAKTIAQQKSKDTSTKVGCLILTPDGGPVSWGYNGMCRGMDDHRPERLERPEKYFWFEHAERNAIYNAARKGIPLSGCHAYVTMFPCMDCARGLVQSGIVKVVTAAPKESAEAIWKEQVARVFTLFNELGIILELHYE